MPWVSVSEAAVAADVSERTVRRWIADNRVNSRRANGRVYVDLTSDRTTPSRHFSDAAKAMAVTSATNLDAVQAALTAVTDAGVHVRRELKTACWTARIAVSGCVMACLAGGVGYHLLDRRHHDAVVMARETRQDAISRLEADHRDVILDLSRRVATSDGLAMARSDELARAAERLDALARDRDQLAEKLVETQSAARGERPDGVPVLLAGQSAMANSPARVGDD